MSKYCIPPKLPARMKRTLSEQTTFGGFVGHPGATGDKLRFMQNLSSTAYPALSVREGRVRKTSLFEGVDAVQGILYHDSLFVACGGKVYRLYDNGAMVTVASTDDTLKQMVVFNHWLYIFPDKLMVDLTSNRCYFMDQSISLTGGVSWSGSTLTSSNVNFEDKGFLAGDGVTLTVYTALSGMSDTERFTVSKVSGYSLTLDRVPRTSGLSYQIKRTVPELDGVCVAHNRLWGFYEQQIYASAEGSGTNWYLTQDDKYMTGETTDAFPVLLKNSSSGNFTACIPWQDYVIFFKKDRICKILGSGSEGYFVNELQAPGVMLATCQSLCNLEGRLYYASSHGVYAYDGAYPQRVDTPQDMSLSRVAGGSDGRVYYLSCKDKDGKYQLYTYDPACQAWYVEDDLRVNFMTRKNNAVCMLTDTGEVIENHGEWGRDTYVEGKTETSVALQASAEFCDEVCCLQDGIRLHKLYVSCKSEADSTLTVSVAYDGDGEYKKIATLEGAHDGWVEIPVPPVRCRYYRLRLDMVGPWRIYAIHREYERGSQG